MDLKIYKRCVYFTIHNTCNRVSGCGVVWVQNNASTVHIVSQEELNILLS